MLSRLRKFFVPAWCLGATTFFCTFAHAFDPCADNIHINFSYNQATKLCDCEGAVKTYMVNNREMIECIPNGSTVGVDQDEAQKQAIQVNKLGSATAASIAIGTCAKGANKALKNKHAGGLMIGNCLDSVVAAQRLKEAELKGQVNRGETPGAPELVVDKEKLKEQEIAKHMKELKENYGLKEDDFVNRTLATKGNQQEFGRILRPTLSLADYKEAMAGAKRNGENADQQRALASVDAKASESENENTFNLAGNSGASDKMGLRNSLREGLYSGSTLPGDSGAEDDDSFSYIGMRQFAPLGSPKSGLIDLKPLSDASGGVLTEKEEALQEYTIFDVVHRKYQEKEFLRRLFSGRR